MTEKMVGIFFLNLVLTLAIQIFLMIKIKKIDYDVWVKIGMPEPFCVFGKDGRAAAMFAWSWGGKYLYLKSLFKITRVMHYVLMIAIILSQMKAR
jgi:hypothetical protein